MRKERPAPLRLEMTIDGCRAMRLELARVNGALELIWTSSLEWK
jgi:hypothetical protein